MQIIHDKYIEFKYKKEKKLQVIYFGGLFTMLFVATILLISYVSNHAV